MNNIPRFLSVSLVWECLWPKQYRSPGRDGLHYCSYTFRVQWLLRSLNELLGRNGQYCCHRKWYSLIWMLHISALCRVYGAKQIRVVNELLMTKKRSVMKRIGIVGHFFLLSYRNPGSPWAFFFLRAFLSHWSKWDSNQFPLGTDKNTGKTQMTSEKNPAVLYSENETTDQTFHNSIAAF